MRRGFWIIVCLLAASPSALARPTNATNAYDLPYCDEVVAYCQQIHTRAECDKLAAEARQRGVWRLDVEHKGYPETDIFTVSVVKKPGAADAYIETRQFGCHAHP